jgi:hypothetical protein
MLGRRIRWSACFFTSMTDLRFIHLRVKKVNSTFNIGDAESKMLIGY